MKNSIKALFLLAVGVFMGSCNNEPTLQKYFIEHQNDQDFISVDIPASILDKESVALSADEKAALQSIKKVNFLAMPLKEGSKDRYSKETQTIQKILKNDAFETLARFSNNGAKVELKYQGEDDDVDEVIVFASKKDSGFLIARVLGDNMRPEKMVKLVNSIEKEKLDMGPFKKIADAFNENL